jgi:hypothetical protein
MRNLRERKNELNRRKFREIKIRIEKMSAECKKQGGDRDKRK